MNHIQTENAVFKYAASFLSKTTVDKVAQFADKKEIYALSYSSQNVLWLFDGGLVLSTQEVIANESTAMGFGRS